MGDSSRIVVTGAGIISAIGVGIAATRESLLASRSGIGEVCHTATSHHEFPVGEVKLSNEELASLTGLIGEASSLRTVLLGVAAGREAISRAGLDESMIRESALIGGTTVGGMDLTESIFGEVLDNEGDCESAAKLKYNDCGYSTSMIADSLGHFKMVTTSSTACSSAANAIMFGARLLKSGIVKYAVAGGSEALSRFHLNGFNTLMILDRDRCRPFDNDRQGINLGEGAAFLVLETEENAMARGAKILGYLSGYSNRCDAFHQTASSDNGEGAYQAMSNAIVMAGITPEDIDYVNAHGTGTPNNDRSELTAMQRIWGKKLPPFSSTKALTGHTTSASGAIETVISYLAFDLGMIPGNIGFSTPDRKSVV